MRTARELHVCAGFMMEFDEDVVHSVNKYCMMSKSPSTSS